MRKSVHFIIISFFYCLCSCAQPGSDSSLQKISLPLQDTSHVWQLYKAAWATMYSQPDTSVTLAQQGILLSRKLHFKKGEAACMDALAEAYNETGDYSQSLSLSFLELKLAENINDTPQICTALTGIASTYSFEHNSLLAIRYYYRAKAIAMHHNYKRLLVPVLNNLSEEFENVHQLDSAIAYANECLRLSTSENNVDFTGCALTNLATIQMKLHKLSVAMHYFRMALPYFKQADDHEYLCRCYVEMAACFQQSRQMDSALHYGNLGMQLALASHIAEWTINGSSFLMNYYKTLHNADSAAAYRLVYIAAKRKRFTKEKAESTNQ